MEDQNVIENDNAFKLVKSKLDSSNINYKLIEVDFIYFSISKPKPVKNQLVLEVQV